MQRASSAILENDVHLRHSHACGEGAYRRGGWRSVHWVEREYGGTAPCAAFRAAVHCAMHVLCDKHRFVHHVVHAPHTCPHAGRRDWRRDLVLHAPPMLVAASGNRLPEQHICMARKHTRTAQAARTMRQTPRRDARQRCRYSRTIAALCGSWEASAHGKLLYCVGHGKPVHMGSYCTVWVTATHRRSAAWLPGLLPLMRVTHVLTATVWPVESCGDAESGMQIEGVGVRARVGVGGRRIGCAYSMVE